ncbi:MAG TPA: hypothetical protein VKB71_15565 [Rhizomicrobium sp.]|nr:hypothetical protein [Rhizomicrobium sp.]
MLKVFAATTLFAYLFTAGEAWADCARPADQPASSETSVQAMQKELVVAALFCGSSPTKEDSLQRNGFYRADADFLTFVVLLRAQAMAQQKKSDR